MCRSGLWLFTLATCPCHLPLPLPNVMTVVLLNELLESCCCCIADCSVLSVCHVQSILCIMEYGLHHFTCPSVNSLTRARVKSHAEEEAEELCILCLAGAAWLNK